MNTQGIPFRAVVRAVSAEAGCMETGIGQITQGDVQVQGFYARPGHPALRLLS